MMYRLRFAALGLAGILMTSGVTLAADVGVYTPPPAPPTLHHGATAFDWNGVYIGINGGYAWGRADALAVPPLTGLNDFNIGGGFGGAQIGANAVLPSNLLVGVEADVQWSGITGSGVVAPAPAATQDINWFGTIRGRLGIAMGNVLPYLTGGLAMANSTRTTAFGPASASNQHTGWVAGGGVEWGFADTWSVKMEYQYIDLGAKLYDFPAGNDPTVDIKLHTIRAGLNKHF